MKTQNLHELNNIDIEFIQSILPLDFMVRHRVVPLKKESTTLYLGMSDPTNNSLLDLIRFQTNSTIIPVIFAESELNKFINQFEQKKLTHSSLQLSILRDIDLEDNKIIQENSARYDEPIIRFVDHLITHALQHQASDIHIESYEKNSRIRYRQDGLLHEITEMPHALISRLVIRLKVMAKLDISERRLPQDGRLHFKNIDIRMSTCPTLFGEKIVLRLLNIKQASLNITALGMSPLQQTIFLKKLALPQGFILVTGPTGSGKTLTLYSMLHHLNTKEKNISTAEDPIEIQLTGINQVQINPKINLLFSTTLRSFLRQDPDIIMVGEIRDLETAEISIQAAQTGHLILSSLHTNSAIETLARLRAIGVHSFDIINSLSLIIGQRLIRVLCQQCKQPDTISQKIEPSIPANIPIYRAEGCSACLNGYYGRTGIFELLPITDSIAQLFLAGKSLNTIFRFAKSEGFVDLRQAGIEKMLEGITSYAEIMRVTSV